MGNFFHYFSPWKNPLVDPPGKILPMPMHRTLALFVESAGRVDSRQRSFDTADWAPPRQLWRVTYAIAEATRTITAKIARDWNWQLQAARAISQCLTHDVHAALRVTTIAFLFRNSQVVETASAKLLLLTSPPYVQLAQLELLAQAQWTKTFPTQLLFGKTRYPERLCRQRS